MNDVELFLSEDALTQEEMMQFMRHGSVGSHGDTETVMSQAVQDLRIWLRQRAVTDRD